MTKKTLVLLIVGASLLFPCAAVPQDTGLSAQPQAQGLGFPYLDLNLDRV